MGINTCECGKIFSELIKELVTSTEGKTDCQLWDTDGWGGYSCIASFRQWHRGVIASAQRKAPNRLQD